MTNNIESTAHRTSRQPLFAIPAVIHWHGLTDKQPLKRTTEIIKYFFCVGLIIFCMFAVLIILKGGETRLISVAGFFIPAHIIQRYSTPAWCFNEPTALEVISSGKGCTVLYYSPNIKFRDMLITEKQNNCATCAQAKSPITAQTIINDILSTDDPENIRETLHEMMLAFFTHYDSPTEEFKERVYCAYRTLYDALKAIEQLNPRRKEVCHANA